MKRDILSLRDLGAVAISELLGRAREFERLRGHPDHARPLQGKAVALLFERPSTRTRLSLEVAVSELGGHPIALLPEVTQLGRQESIEDTARVFGRTVSAVAYRASSEENLTRMARACRVPVVNALSESGHPLQVLADVFTIQRVFGQGAPLTIAWFGDASNVARSWMDAAVMLGFRLRLSCPTPFAPTATDLALVRPGTGTLEVVSDPRQAAEGAHVLMTDVWVSMGQEKEAAARKRALLPYRLTESLLQVAAPEAIVLHCLPAHRGEEIETSVLDGPQSYAWECVEARIHTTKAALEWALLPRTPGSAPLGTNRASEPRRQ